MCGESYFHQEWPSSLPSGGEVELLEWETEYLDGLEDDDDLPDFGDPEEDGEDWDEDDWFFQPDDELYGAVQRDSEALEDAIMLMNEDELLEWLLLDETEFTGRRLDSCGESARLEEAA